MYEAEQDLKKAAMANDAKCCESAGARIRDTLGMYDSGCRVTLQERVGAQLQRARYEAGLRDRLEELRFLLDKNPEIARILDLLDDLKK